MRRARVRRHRRAVGWHRRKVPLRAKTTPQSSCSIWLQACARAPTAPGASTRHPKARVPLASWHGRRLEVPGCGVAPLKRLLRSVDGTLCRARVRGFVLQRRVPCTTTACQTVVGTGATSGALRRIRWRRARVRRHRRAAGGAPPKGDFAGQNNPQNSCSIWLHARARTPTAPGASTRHPKARLPLASCHGRRLEVHGCGGALPKAHLRSQYNLRIFCDSMRYLLWKT